MAGTDSIGSDFVAHMVTVAHTEANIGSDTDWVGTMEADMMVASVHLEPAPHYSSSKYQPPFPSRVGMLYSLFPHVPLIYKI